MCEKDLLKMSSYRNTGKYEVLVVEKWTLCYGRLTHFNTIQTSFINAGKLTVSSSEMEHNGYLHRVLNSLWAFHVWVGEHLLGIFRSKMENNMSSAHIVLFKESWYSAVADVCSIIVCYKHVQTFWMKASWFCVISGSCHGVNGMCILLGFYQSVLYKIPDELFGFLYCTRVLVVKLWSSQVVGYSWTYCHPTSCEQFLHNLQVLIKVLILGDV